MKRQKGEKNPVMNKLTKEIRSQYLPQKIKEKQYADNPELLESLEKKQKKTNQNLKSTLEYSAGVDEFVSMAKLANKKYEPLQEQVVIQNIHNENLEIQKREYNKILLENTTKSSDISLFSLTAVQIPKRPRYKKGMKAKEFETLENESYLNWRRALSELEQKNENLVVTPYEKNISVWRQLWITIEKCQVLIQIVDARNPLFYRSKDLENYIKEVDKNKEYLLLVNKADLLSEELRISWSDYFIKNNLSFVFFSALEEDTKLEEPIESNVKVDNEQNDDESDDEEETEEDEDINEKVSESHEVNKDNVDKINSHSESKVLDKLKEEIPNNIIENITTKQDLKDTEKSKNAILNFYPDVKESDYKVYNREELIEVIKKLSKGKEKYHNTDSNFIGFIGYPNVGKSSVINVLMMKKKVGVALMPGKTKHYQTLFLPNDKEICLMDCPGLVFPSFTFSKADLVINGIMPIDKIVDYLIPIQLVTYNIPRNILEDFYKIKLPDLYSSSQFLQVLALKHNYLTGRSIASEAKTAKIVLKDYVSGKLLYCYPRPDYKEDIHGDIYYYLFNSKGDEEKDKIKEFKETTELLKQIPADFNDNIEKIAGFEGTDKQTLKNYHDLDTEFFAMNDVDLEQVNQSKIPKEIRMLLKFAMKRGDITEEEFEDCYTVEEAKIILDKLDKQGKQINQSKKGKNIIETKVIDNYNIIKK